MKIETAKQIEKEKQKLIKHLDTRGLKFTSCRQVVFDEAMKAHGHFAAEELFKQCKKHKRKVSRATVYRALHDLLEAGIIRETAYGEKHQHFEHIYDEKPHHHAKCVHCGDFIEFPDLGEDKVYRPILEDQGFKILGHEMHFYGICASCQSKNK